MWIMMTLAMFAGDDKSPVWLKLWFVIVGIGVTAIFYFTVMKYMVVSIDDDFLYVSNYSKEISTPLSNIEKVTELVWVRGHPVTIHLKTASDFGSKIVFTPKAHGFRFFSANPLVAELNELARLKSAEAIARS